MYGDIERDFKIQGKSKQTAHKESKEFLIWEQKLKVRIMLEAVPSKLSVKLTMGRLPIKVLSLPAQRTKSY